MSTSPQLSHAYLVESRSAEERRRLSLTLAATAVCAGDPAPCGSCRHCRKAYEGIHPDIASIERELSDKGKKRRETYVSQVRSVIADSVVLPNEAEKKVYIFTEADTLNISAQNALLRLLEEPPRYVVIILCCENSLALLDTVRSRCISLRHNAETQQLTEYEAYALEYLQIYGEKNALALAKFCTLREGLDTAETTQLVTQIKQYASDALCLRSPAKADRRELNALIKKLTTAETYLRSNVSPKHVLGYLSILK